MNNCLEFRRFEKVCFEILRQKTILVTGVGGLFLQQNIYYSFFILIGKVEPDPPLITKY